MWSQLTKVIVYLFVLIVRLDTKQTLLLSELNRADKSSLLLAKELFPMIESNRKFNSVPYRCLNLLPNELLKSKVSPQIEYLNITSTQFKPKVSKEKQIRTKNLQDSLQNQQKQIIDTYQDYDYDRILDLLHGTCAIHETNQFLYEYCHKEKVRQFDSFETFQRMAKVDFEDIAMGYFDYQKAIENSQNQENSNPKQKYSQNDLSFEDEEIQTLRTLLDSFSEYLSSEDRVVIQNIIKQSQEESKASKQGKVHKAKGKKTDPNLKVKKMSLPLRSQIYDANNLFTASATNHREFTFDKEIGLIRVNEPLVRSNTYFVHAKHTFQIYCDYIVKEDGEEFVQSQYISYGRSISPFEIVFMGNISKCSQISKISHSAIETQYQSPQYIQKVRGFKNYLYGQIDSACTNNWAWSKKTGDFKSLAPEREDFLEKGTTLLLEMTFNRSGEISLSHIPVEIKEIVAPGAVLLYQNLQEFLGQQKFPPRKSSPHESNWISGCRVISKKVILQDTANENHKILERGIIKIAQDEQKSIKQSGDQLLCMCRFEKYREQFLEMHLTLGNEVVSLYENQADENSGKFSSYFEYYHQETVKVLTNGNKKLHQICRNFICYDIAHNFEVEEDKDSQDEGSEQEEQATELDPTQGDAPEGETLVENQFQEFPSEIDEENVETAISGDQMIPEPTEDLEDDDGVLGEEQAVEPEEQYQEDQSQQYEQNEEKEVEFYDQEAVDEDKELTMETEQQTDEQIVSRSFTSIYRLSPKTKHIDFQSESPFSEDNSLQESLLLLDIFKGGLLKINTREGSSSSPTLSTYILTQSKILKITTFSNNTKKIYLENSYYQNQSFNTPQSWLSNSILLHRGLIWRYGDRLIFPRMQMAEDEVILSISLESGLTYIRRWDLTLTQERATFKASEIDAYIRSHYQVKARPLFTKENQRGDSSDTVRENLESNDNLAAHGSKTEKEADALTLSDIDQMPQIEKPLNKSVGIRYSYFHGDYCAEPINKNRRTDVLIECGQPWLELISVKEDSPCVYEMIVQSRLLCHQQFESPIASFDEIQKEKESRVSFKKSMVCYPEDSWDDVRYAYFLDTEDVLYIQE